MSEWPIEHAWKACLPQGNEGSNPSLSAFHSAPLVRSCSVLINELKLFIQGLECERLISYELIVSIFYILKNTVQILFQYIRVIPVTISILVQSAYIKFPSSNTLGLKLFGDFHLISVLS